MNVPFFSNQFSFLNEFILGLVGSYRAGKINSWDDLESRVHDFFTPERMGQMEACISGWQKMSSYNEGVTLTHVMCVFLGLLMLPEYANLTTEQQELMKWTILLHDVAKVVEQGRRDPKHGFRSAVIAAQNLPALGFDTTPDYEDLIDAWSELTNSAVTMPEGAREPIQDNRKLPEILSGIDRLFRSGSPATLIIKTVLLHVSINVVKEWPQAAPLSQAEIRQYVDPALFPLMQCMMLADNEGWSMFHAEYRAIQRQETLDAFERIKSMTS